MEPQQILMLISRFEKDMAEFYAKLKHVSMLNECVGIFESMETCSHLHSTYIISECKPPKISHLNIEPLTLLHNNVKDNFLNEIKNESSIRVILKKMANAEEQTGKIYKSIAKHYSKFAESYQILSDEISEIGDDQFIHRDSILEELEQLAKP
jgi:hypothetical protein